MSEAKVKQVIDAFNRHDAAGFASGYATDAVVYDPQYDKPLRGRESIREDLENFVKAFPDVHGSVTRLVEQGNVAAFEFSFKGTHKGPMVMPGGEVPPTNRSMTFTGAVFVRFNGQGLVEEERRYYDTGAMMQQLGLAPQ